MEGSVGIKLLFVLGVCAAAVLGALLASAPQAMAVSSIPGRIFILSDIGSTRGDLFRTTRINTWKRLTFGLSGPESLSASPNGNFVTLCATKTVGGTYRIYRIPANGGPLKSLIGNRAGCDPTVSPDSRKVAYVQGGPAASKLNVVSARGGKPRTIYRFCSSCLYGPVWAGKRIYFERRIARNISADLEIYSVRASDGKGLKRHTNDGGAPIDYQLEDVNPSGRRILVRLSDSTAPGSNDLVLLSRTGSEVRQIVQGGVDPSALAGAAFSPSANRVAFNLATFGLRNVWVSNDITAPFIVSSQLANPAVAGSAAGDGPYSIDWTKR
jgi:hypothetical protein